MKIFWLGVIWQCVSLVGVSFIYGVIEEEDDYFVYQSFLGRVERERGVTETFSHNPEFEELYQCIQANDFNEFTRLLSATTIKNKKEFFVIDINTRIHGGRGETFLIYLVTEGCNDGVNILLKARPDLDVNAQCTNGNTALHRAVLNQDYYLTELLLQDERIKINIKNDKKHTARYYTKKNKKLKDLFSDNKGCCIIV